MPTKQDSAVSKDVAPDSLKADRSIRLDSTLIAGLREITEFSVADRRIRAENELRRIFAEPLLELGKLQETPGYIARKSTHAGQVQLDNAGQLGAERPSVIKIELEPKVAMGIGSTPANSEGGLTHATARRVESPIFLEEVIPVHEFAETDVGDNDSQDAETFFREPDLFPIELEYMNETVEETVADFDTSIVSVDGHLELLFDLETVEAYRQLAALTAPVETSQSVTLETIETEGGTVTEIDLEANIEVGAIPSSETFVAAQLANEKPVTLETIHAQADTQPLEQTLTQLVVYLSEVDEEEPESTGLIKIVHELEARLLACYLRKETGEITLSITPEMTEKLLIFLCAFGYEQPGEALVKFVTRYDIEFLLQAIKYLCQLAHEDNKREFLRSSLVTVASTTDDTTRIRLSKVLFWLIAKLTFEPFLQQIRVD